ncbi:MAG: GTP-binding protein [archaeon]|nr:GTP-binding protein [archaeon]
MKILVTGPFQCGKSAYISALDSTALNIMTRDRNNHECTIGMDIGTVNINGIRISLFGSPGLLRFKTMRNITAEGADGVIFIFDGEKPESDDSAIQILNEIRGLLPKNTPIVYAINKIDAQNSRPIEVVRKQNYLPKNAKIFGISAKNKKNIEEPLLDLIKMIKIKLIPLLKTLENFQNNPLGLKIALNKTNAEEITHLLNAMEQRGIILIDRHNLTYKVLEQAKIFINEV